MRPVKTVIQVPTSLVGELHVDVAQMSAAPALEESMWKNATSSRTLSRVAADRAAAALMTMKGQHQLANSKPGAATTCQAPAHQGGQHRSR